MSVPRYATFSLFVWVVACPFLMFPTLIPGGTAVSLLLLIGLRIGAFKVYGRFLRPNLLNSFILIYLFLSGIAFIISPLPGLSLRRLLILTLGIFGYLSVLDWMQTGPQVKRLAMLLALVGGVMALIGFFAVEWPTRYVVNLDAVTARLPHLFDRPIMHHNQLAGILLLLMPLALALWRCALSRRQRLLFAFISLLMGLALFLTQSRNAWLGLVVVLLVWLFRKRYGAGIRWQSVLIWLLLCVSLPFVLDSLPDSANTIVHDNLAWLDTASKVGHNNDQSWLSRLEIWSVAIEMVTDYPVLGAGLYTFMPISRANYVYHIVDPAFNMEHAHHLFLQTAVSLGWAGVAALGGLWLVVLYRLWSSSPAEDIHMPWLTAGISASFAGYLSFNLFDILMFEQEPGVLVWLLLALAVRLTGGRFDGPHPRFLKFVQLAPYLTLILLSLTPLLSHNWANLQLDQARLSAAGDLAGLSPQPFAQDGRRRGLLLYRQGNRAAALHAWQTDPEAVLFLQSQGQLAVLAGTPLTALEWYALALALDPAAGSVYYWRGQVYEVLGHPDQALVDYGRAIHYLEDAESDDTALLAEAWEAQGRLLARQEAWAAAAHAFAQAAFLDPTMSDYQQQLQDVLAALREQAQNTAK